MTFLALVMLLSGDIEQQPTQPTEKPAHVPVMTKPPELVSRVEPAYPQKARDEKRAGDVDLMLTIDDAGVVVDVKVKASSGFDDIDEAAMEAARQFTFKPAEFDGKPGRCAIEFVQHFTLESQSATKPSTPGGAVPSADNGASKSASGAASTSSGAAGAQSSTPSTSTTANPAGDAAAARATEPLTEANGAPESSVELAIAGVVRAAVTKLPLADVEVTLDTETEPVVTDAQGRFLFERTKVKSGSHRITMAGSGWITGFVDVVVEDGKRTDVIAYLEPSDGNTFETVVKEKRAVSEVTRVSLARDEVKTVPGTFGDPLRVLENLPGMARSSFIGGQLIVRGANPEDSSVLFDGIPIPQLYHFQGLKSVVNPEFLEDISFYPGGFPAKYGRATGGIVDVSSRELPSDAFRGAVDVNLLDADFFLSLPLDQLGVPHTTVALAARRSYIDALLPSVLQFVTPPGGQSIVAAPVYWDYQAKLETKLDANTFSLFAFGSSDSIKVEAQGLGNNTSLGVDAGQQFHRVAFRWKWRIGEGVENVFQPFVGIDNTSVSGGGSGLNLGVGGGAYSWGVRDELKLTPLPSVRASIGVDYLGNSTSTDVNIPFSPTFGGFPQTVNAPSTSDGGEEIKSDIAKNSIAIYAQSEVDVVNGLMIIPGIRAEITQVNFEPEVASDGTSTAPSTSTLSAVDPRFAVRWDVLPKLTTLKASAGLYHEPPTNAQLSASGGNPALLQPTAMQLIGGFEQKLTDDLHLDFETYLTDRYYLVETPGGGGGGGGRGVAIGGGGGPGAIVGVRGGSTSTSTAIPDNSGTGWTYGAEVLLRHDISKYFYGWIAYTLSRTTIDTTPGSTTQELSQFDQTHILTVVAQGKLPWGFSLGGRFRYVTGDPTSVPAGSFHDLDTGNYTKLSSGTQGRLPAFIQLDARVDKRFSFDNLALTAYVDCQNVTNYQNVEGTISDYRNEQTDVIPGLPILPIVGLSGEF
jgi:TonB family protein